MGQILPFPARRHQACAVKAGSLDTAEAVFLKALRSWTDDTRRSVDPLPRLREQMSAVGADDAAFSVNQLMCVIAHAAWRQVKVGCLRCPDLSPDEQCVLHAARLAQADETSAAKASLRLTFLPPEAAEFAMGPIEGTGIIFRAANLVFSQRSHPAGDDRNVATTEVERMPPANH